MTFLLFSFIFVVWQMGWQLTSLVVFLASLLAVTKVCILNDANNFHHVNAQ